MYDVDDGMRCRSLALGKDPDGAIEEVEVHISQELLQHLPVAGVMGQVLVKLRSDRPYLPQVPPRGIGEVVVLQVVPQIQVEDVPDADVVIGLLALNELVVLCDDVDGSGVGSDGDNSGNDEEEEGGGSPEVVDGVVGEDDEEVVHALLAVYAGVLHEDRPERVEHLNHRVEEVLVPSVLRGQLRLPEQGQVGVAIYLPQEVVVVGVVPSEGDAGGERHGDVAQDSHDLVDGGALVASEVGEVVDAAVQGVIEQSTYQIGIKQQHPDVLVLNEGRSTFAQQPLARLRRMTASAMMMVQGLSTTSSCATWGYLVRIIFLLTRWDSSPFKQVQSCLTPLLWSYMCSSPTGGVFRLVRQFTAVSTGSPSLLFGINDYRRTEFKTGKIPPALINLPEAGGIRRTIKRGILLWRKKSY